MVQSTDVLFENVSCRLGCEENDEILFSAHALLHDMLDEVSVDKCRTCPHALSLGCCVNYKDKRT